MCQKPAMTGSRLLDLGARRLKNGYWELVATTDTGVFGLGRSGVTSLEQSAQPGFHSQLTDSYRNAMVQEVWTDGDSLFVLLDQSRCLVYEYVLPGTSGGLEALRLVDDPTTVNQIKADLERDPDARRIS
jgi:hypothetical protein